jgi:Ras family protein A
MFKRRSVSAVSLPLYSDSTRLQWISEVQHFCPGLPVVLVGCKKDLRRDPRVIEELRRTNQRPVTAEEVRQTSVVSDDRSLTHVCGQGTAIAQKIGARHYLECSARTGEGVREVFQYATRAALLSRSGKKRSGGGCLVI